MSTLRKAATEAQRLSDEAFVRIAPLLAGRPPEIQSAVLADLTARWLAGYQGGQEIREALLGMFIKAVKELTPVNEMIMRDERGEKPN